MDIEGFFDFLAPDDIRIKGTRIGMESILYEYIHRGKTAEEIAESFPSLSLEQVYATLLYYLHNRERLDTYLADWLTFAHTARDAQQRNPPPVVLQLRRRKAKSQVT